MPRKKSTSEKKTKKTSKKKSEPIVQEAPEQNVNPPQTHAPQGTPQYTHMPQMQPPHTSPMPQAAPNQYPNPVYPAHGYPSQHMNQQMPHANQQMPHAGQPIPGHGGHMAYPGATYPQMANPQLQNQMAQMMQMMMGAHSGIPGMDPAAQPFKQQIQLEDEDPGLDADIIRPHQLRSVVKIQEPVSIHEVLDSLCLTENGKYSLGGIPKGCTIALVGPPGKGKTRTAIHALCKMAFSGVKSAFVVAEEGFIDDKNSGRDDLSSRLTKIGMKTLKLSEAQFQKKVAKNIAVIQSQYHKGHSWDSFVSRYRFIVEKEGIKFVIIDSLNTLDPSKTKTADNLSALKTYNHEKGVTCVTIGQIKDTGMPVGGEALIHTADAVFLIEEMSLGSKDIANFWGGAYREKITVIKAIKSVTTPIFPHPIRIDKDKDIGVFTMHEAQPEEYKPLPLEE